MEKKFKFSDKSAVSKIVYLTVIAILCVSAIVIGIVASNSRKKVDPTPELPGDNTGDTGNNSDDGGNNGGENPGDSGSSTTPEVKLTFVSPVVGTVIKSHSTTSPVFSLTLDEWRIHTGLDVSTEELAEVYAAADGEVTNVYVDPMLGNTVEITHSDTHKTTYSNLSADGIAVEVGAQVKGGDLIGRVGDTSVIELCDEPHLHFEMFVSGASVNPLDYLSEDSKEASLGIMSPEE